MVCWALQSFMCSLSVWSAAAFSWVLFLPSCTYLPKLKFESLGKSAMHLLAWGTRHACPTQPRDARSSSTELPFY